MHHLLLPLLHSTCRMFSAKGDPLMHFDGNLHSICTFWQVRPLTGREDAKVRAISLTQDLPKNRAEAWKGPVTSVSIQRIKMTFDMNINSRHWTNKNNKSPFISWLWCRIRFTFNIIFASLTENNVLLGNVSVLLTNQTTNLVDLLKGFGR